MKIKIEYIPAQKGGRCWNRAHRDRGIITHAVPKIAEGTTGFWGEKALCGK